MFKQPKEITLKIFSDFTPAQLAQAAFVSKKWQQMADHNLLWKKFLEPRKLETYLESNSLKLDNISCKDIYINHPEMRKTEFRDYDKKGIEYSRQQIESHIKIKLDDVAANFSYRCLYVEPLKKQLLKKEFTELVRTGKFDLNDIFALVQTDPMSGIAILAESLTKPEIIGLIESRTLIVKQIFELAKTWPLDHVAEFVSRLTSDNIEHAFDLVKKEGPKWASILLHDTSYQKKY